MRYVILVQPNPVTGAIGAALIVGFVLWVYGQAGFGVGLGPVVYVAVLVACLVAVFIVWLCLALLRVPQTRVISGVALIAALGGWAAYVADDVTGGPDRRAAVRDYAVWGLPSVPPGQVHWTADRYLREAGLPPPGPDTGDAVFRQWQLRARDAAQQWYPRFRLGAALALGDTTAARPVLRLVFPSLWSMPSLRWQAPPDGPDARCRSYSCAAATDVFCTLMLATPEEVVGLRPPPPFFLGKDGLMEKGYVQPAGATPAADWLNAEAVRRLQGNHSQAGDWCRTRFGLQR